MAASTGILLFVVISFLHEYTTNAGFITNTKQSMKIGTNTVLEQARKCIGLLCGKYPNDTSYGTWPYDYLGCKIAAYAVRGDEVKGKRHPMEDRYSVERKKEFVGFAVYDGHRDADVAEYAKKNLLTDILTTLVEHRTADPVELITKRILAFDEKVREKFISGSTAVLGVLHKEKLYIANVGDSRAVARRNGKIWQTIDHLPNRKKEQELKERQRRLGFLVPDQESELDRIIRNGGFVEMGQVGVLKEDGEYDYDKGTVSMSRALGDKGLKEKDVIIAKPDITVIDWKSDDVSYVILASDGLWKTAGNEYVINKVQDTTWLFGAAELANDAKTHTADDVTVMIVKLLPEKKARNGPK